MRWIWALSTLLLTPRATAWEDPRALRDFETTGLDQIPGLRGNPTHRRKPIAVGPDGIVTRPARAPFSLFVLPDTQGYTDGGCYQSRGEDAPCFLPRTFRAQTRYIRRFYDHPLNNAIFVVHLGDVVDDAKRALEWRRARRAMDLLDSFRAGGRRHFIPYGIAPGNHDFISWRDGRSEFRAYQRHFSLAGYRRRNPRWRAWLGSARLGLRNSLHLFNAGGDRYLVLLLEYCPDDATLRWARWQLTRHRDRRALVVTHAAADRQGRWFRRCMRGKPGNSGQAIWTRLVRPAPNVHFVLGGHAGYGLGWNAWLRKRTADGTLTAWWRKTGWDGGTYARHRAADGHTVHVLVANYQHLYRGGHGFMRRMRFVPDGNRVEVVTFSPHARRRLCDEDPRCADAGYVNDPRRQVLRCNNLVIRYSMTGGQRPAGSSAR